MGGPSLAYSGSTPTLAAEPGQLHKVVGKPPPLLVASVSGRACAQELHNPQGGH